MRSLTMYIAVAVVLPFLAFLVAVIVMDHQTDQYCKTTPLDRIDRERCGLENKQ